MKLHRLEHVNIQSTNTSILADWYTKILGLHAGYRPPFNNSGYWLYLEKIPVIHLVQVDKQSTANTQRIEHFAVSATGLQDFLQFLKTHSVEYRLSKVPELGDMQVNIFDPDGNRIHIDFSREEAETLNL